MPEASPCVPVVCKSSRCQPFWNSKSLDAPPLVTFEYSAAASDFKKASLDDLLARFVDLTAATADKFNAEVGLLDKLIAKNWNCLRKEKSVQYMKKLKALAKSYSALGLPSLAADLSSSSNSSRSQNSSSRLASREYFEYFLVRLVGAHGLLSYAMDLVKFKISVHLMKSISNAVYLANNLLFLSVCARIYSCMKKYAASIADVYNLLRQSLHLLQGTQLKWTDQPAIDDLLPSALAVQRLAKQDDSFLSRLADHQYDQKFADKVNDLSRSEQTSTPSLVQATNGSQVQDLGERIERTPVTTNSFKKRRKLFFKKLTKLLQDVKSAEDLKPALRKLRKLLARKCSPERGDEDDRQFFERLAKTPKTTFAKRLKAVASQKLPFLLANSKKSTKLSQLVVKKVRLQISKSIKANK